MAKDNLIKKLKNTAHMVVAAGVLGLGAVYGCGDNPVEVDMFPQPTTENMSPTSGMAPLLVTTQYECTDDRGIRSYEIVKNGETIRDGPTPIDSLITFMEDGNLRVKCTDTGNQTIGYPREGPMDIKATQPPQPTVTQTAELTNYVDINVITDAANVPEATRETYHNGNTSFPHSETLTESLIGNWRFIGTAPGAIPDTAEVDVLDYESEAPDLSGVNIDGNERDSIEVHLARATEINKEQRPVKYTGVTATEGVEASIGAFPNDTVLKIKWPEIPGPNPVPYSIELTREGSLETITLEGKVLDVPVLAQIAFWSNRPVPEEGYNEEIYSMNLDGTGLQRLTTDPGKDLEPTYSPDGTELLFTSHRTGGTAVWRMNEDGSNQRDITSDIVERARQADWCSNGLIAVAYRNLEDSVAGIGIINPDENSFTPIYSEPRTGSIPGWPKWSPDCSEIVFHKYNGVWDIWKMKADGNNLINLTNHPAGDGLPVWSPDGKEIAFMSDREGSLDIHKMNSDGSNVRILTNDSGSEVDPAWSPDGTKLIFVHDAVGLFNPQIYIMNSDGSGEWTQLTFDGSNRYPAWRPGQ
jgi:hypothetical protein